MCSAMTTFSQFHNKKVLITGVAGFIGSHLAEEVLRSGGKVVGVDNFITGFKKNIEPFLSEYPEQFVFIHADASSDPHQYLPENSTFDYVLHFASPASPPQYQKKPVETYLINSMGTHQLLSYLSLYSPKAVFVFASTSEVYGDPQIHPQPESYWGNVNPNGIRSCYDEAKRMGETICGVFGRDFDMDTRIVRIFNTYGPRIDLDDGRVIPALISAGLHNTPFNVFGDGKQTRSFCFVDDLVEGILSLLVSPSGKQQTVNLGNPEEYTILQAVETFENVIQKKLAIEYADLPKDDPVRRKPDISKAKSLLHWEPTVNFEEGIKRTWEYFKI